MSKETCSGCHSAEKAGDNCLNCHNYHVGEFKAAEIDTDLMKAIEPPPEETEPEAGTEAESAAE